MDTRFHCVYLLTSLDPQCQGQFYIGYTVNPLRRLRQHNGELVNGARRTSRSGRPWTLVCCVSGFPEDRAALKFEWSWQHPTVSAKLKHTAADALAGLRRLPLAVGTLHYLLRTDLFSRLQLKLHIFEGAVFDDATAAAAAHAQAGPRRAVRRVLSQTATDPAPSTTSAGLPALAPSHLLSIEATTREAFEDTYLAHDRCLGRHVADVSSLQELSVLSCPFDVSVLSQIVQDEQSRLDSNADEEGSEAGGAIGDPYEGEAEGRSRWSPTPSVPADLLTPPQPASPSYSASDEESDWDASREGSCEALNEDEDEDDEMNLVRAPAASPRSPLPVPCASPPRPSRGASTPAKTPCSERSARRCASAPVDVVPSPGTPIGGELGRAEITWTSTATPSRASPRSPVSVVSATPTTTAAAAWPHRLPRRFRHYKEADFLRDHAEEQAQLEAGMLPCTLCALPLQAVCVLRCPRAPFCTLRCHLTCLALWAHAEVSPGLRELFAPTHPTPPAAPAPASVPVPAPLSLVPCAAFGCPLCHAELHWAALVKALKQRAVTLHAVHAQRRRLQAQAVWEARLATMAAAHQRQRTAERRDRAAPPVLVPRVDDNSVFSAPATTTTVITAISAAPHTSRKRVRAGSPSVAAARPPRGEAETVVGLSLTQFDASEW